MAYSSLKECLTDLERNGHLIRIHESVDPNLEMAAIHRRVYAAGGPAIFYEQVKESPFPAVSNIFGTEKRLRFIFRHTLHKVEQLIKLRKNPYAILKNFYNHLDLPFTLAKTFPKKKSPGSMTFSETTIDQLPQLKFWPADGGTFITLPQVLSADPLHRDIRNTNLGMYRIQLSGNQYIPNKEIGLHYQIHRGIGIHHTQALEIKKSLPVSIFIGGPPAHTIAAIMPMPEKLSELAFAGVLGGRRFRYIKNDDFYISAEADFCINGYIQNDRLLPEGPFGDHLGYYSMQHLFPVLKVEHVYYRKDAVWPFTVVGRPPQEDSIIGKFIHDITQEIVPLEIPGIREVHAVDAAGVHPLLLVIGSERYVPFEKRKPKELMTQANAILGFGQLSLAKYVWIAAGEDNPSLKTRNIPEFFQHMFRRVRWETDIHFQTRTTIDTLDYSGTGLNQGSKVIFTAAGEPVRNLNSEIPADMRMIRHLKNIGLILPGLLVIETKSFQDYDTTNKEMQIMTHDLGNSNTSGIALIVLVDELNFVKQSMDNFLWITFTRSNPSHDIYGVNSFTENKHWGCHGPLLIDARLKPHHAPPLIEDPEVEKAVDRLGEKGHSLYGII